MPTAPRQSCFIAIKSEILLVSIFSLIGVWFAPSLVRAEPILHLPFQCHENWFGRTYGGHNGGGAGEFSIDWVEQSGAGSPFGSPGRPVLASAAGTVIPVNPDPRGYGNFVDVDHGGGLVTRYAHLSRIDVSRYQHVDAGTQLGLSGSTGAVSPSTFAHLHYEQRQGGTIRRAVFEGTTFGYVYTAPGVLWKSENCASSDPVGNLEIVTESFLSIRVQGWAGDADAGEASIKVHVYVDGAFTAELDASQPRSDALPVPGANHGFDAVLRASIGAHDVCAHAINVGGGTNQHIGACERVYVGHAPGGSLDQVTGALDRVRVVGWAADPDAGAAPIDVHVYVDGAGAAILSRVNLARADVGAVYPEVGGAHGFDTSIKVGAGKHRVCAHAINVGAGSNVLLGCLDAAVSGNPIGNLESIEVVPGGFRVIGWAIDPQGAGGTTEAHVYVSGVGTPLLTATPRADVSAAYPDYPANHGFNAIVQGQPAPANQVCVYAANVGAGSSQLLRCQNYVGVNPTGNLERAEAWSAGHVRLAGWAGDADLGTGSTQVDFYSDPADPTRIRKLGSLVASTPRPDGFPVPGQNHGFDTVLAAPTGTHQVCAYSINAGPGTNTTIGCRTLTIP